MSLAANERMTAGFVRDTDAANALVTTTDDTDARVSAGFLRDPDGRLVTTDDASDALMRAGFLRDATTDALVKTPTTP